MNHPTDENNSDKNRAQNSVDNRSAETCDASGADWAGLIDARALWWRGPERCGHDRDLGDCDCRTEAGWDFGSTSGGTSGTGLVGAITLAGHRYVTDRRLLIREDRLSNWPGPHHPHYPFPAEMTGPRYTASAVALTTLLATPQASRPTTKTFNPDLLDPVTDAGYTVRPLMGESQAHAVVAPGGLRVGLLMPILPRIDLTGQATATAQPAGSARAEGSRS